MAVFVSIEEAEGQTVSNSKPPSRRRGGNKGFFISLDDLKKANQVSPKEVFRGSFEPPRFDDGCCLDSKMATFFAGFSNIDPA